MTNCVGVTPTMAKSCEEPQLAGPTFAYSNVSRLNPLPEMTSAESPFALAKSGLTEVMAGLAA